MKTRMTGLAAALMGAVIGTADANEIPKAEAAPPLILPDELLEPLPRLPLSSLLPNDILANQAAAVLAAPTLKESLEMDAVVPEPAAAPIAKVEVKPATPRDLFSVLDQTPIYIAKVTGTDVTYLRYNDPNRPEFNASIKNAFFDSGAQAVCIEGDVDRILSTQAIVPYECRDVMDLSAAFVKGLADSENKGLIMIDFYDKDVYATGSIDTFKVGENAPADVRGHIHKTRWDPAAREIVYTFMQFSQNKRTVYEQEVARQPLNSSAYVMDVLIRRDRGGSAPNL